MSRRRPLLTTIICALLAGPATTLQAVRAQQEGVHWQDDIESAKATAKQTGKLVLVHFWTPSCAPCLALDQSVFNQPGVAGAIESQFVPVKLNANENPATATGFGITRVPTDIVLTPDGQVVGKLISPPTPAAYVAEVSQVAAQHATQAGQTFAQAAAAAPMPPQLNSAYANLPIAPNTLPAIVAQAQDASPDRYAFGSLAGRLTGSAPGTAGTPSVTDPQTIGTSGAFASWPGASAASAASTAPPAVSQPAAATSVPTYDRYAMAPTTPAAVSPVAEMPNQVANPYASATSPPVTTPAMAPTATVNPYADATAAVATSAAPGGQAPNAAAVPPAGGADARVLPANAPPLGFDGYCPVSMRNEWKWVPGDPRWGIVHRGRTYRFAGQEEQQQFWADPDRFSPALSGMDPVMAIDHQQQVPGKREHSLDYDNLFYMFASEATLQQFTANPSRYAAAARQAMGIERGRLVR